MNLCNSGQSSDFQQNKSTSESFVMINERPSNMKKRAKVLCDYDAADLSELSLMADEIITVTEDQDLEPDYMIGERDQKRGKVPKAFLEIIA